jgi:ubiquinone/menaquinone biosynthesis C-methylase UbiE
MVMVDVIPTSLKHTGDVQKVFQEIFRVLLEQTRNPYLTWNSEVSVPEELLFKNLKDL